MTAELDRLLVAAAEWRRSDPDPHTRAQMEALIERGDPAELRDHLGSRLDFGTAGIRGRLGPGPNRMNRVVVRQTVTGVCRHLLDTVSRAADRGVVLARDARHGSAAFAGEAVQVLLDHGIDVHRFDRPVPTPLGVFAVTELGAAAGIVITASHNPGTDNGMKVIWSDGAQIAPPVDSGIRAAIDEGRASPPTRRRSRRGVLHDLGSVAGDGPVVRAYLDRVRSLRGGATAEPLHIAITSMHGVGAELLERALAEAGHEHVHTVASQRHPDPDFPTLAFPNPEEPGALDALLGLAKEVRADVALANDPDADRLAVAVPDPAGAHDGWRVLTGDEVGVLLLHHLLPHGTGAADRFAATTVVSSRLASRMCAAAGVRFVETLTGFKWLCRPGLEHPEWHQVLLYEEALGYAVGHGARDKDGITAALAVLELVADLRSTGRDLSDVLDDLTRGHGAFVSSNGSLRAPPEADPESLRRAAQALASDPPSRLGGSSVVGTDRPAPDVLRLYLEDDTRVVVRPSGTEPKVKYYCEAIEPCTGRSTPAMARDAARLRLEPVVASLRGLLER